MRINEIAGDKSRSLLIGDVASDAFNPVTTSRSVHVGLMVDIFTLRVVPVIIMITATTEMERDSLARAAIIDRVRGVSYRCSARSPAMPSSSRAKADT